LMLATQNPVELQGTFPLPEAQLDRFLMCIRLGYPDENEEQNILIRFQQNNPLDKLTSVISTGELLEIQRLCRQVYVDESIRSYAVAITRATRTHKGIELGASPRATLGLSLAAQALAIIRGRNYVMPDDVKYLAVPVLAHRLSAKAEARIKGRSLEAVVKEIIDTVPVPVEK
jgi:MoxR-like ATPase